MVQVHGAAVPAQAPRADDDAGAGRVHRRPALGDEVDAVVMPAPALAERVALLRIFRDEEGRTNRSLVDVRGEALVVSQFTLFADTSRGRRPGFTGAAGPEAAERLYQRFAASLREHDVRVETGRFGAEMAVELVNDGPFTIWLDTAER